MIGGMDSFCQRNRKAVPKISAYIYFINFVTHRTGAEESQTGKDRKSMSFQGKTAVITGASSGIGLLCAQCFAEQGANIVMLATNPTKLQSKVDALTAKENKKQNAYRLNTASHNISKKSGLLDR